jgi:uroporphyrinogen decarboxylase
MRSEDVVVYLHMCGNVMHLLDCIPSTGVDCFEPIDEVAGTRLVEVKQRIGDKLALMGGVNTVTLSQGTEKDVRTECRRCLREGAAGGGYVLAACDMLPTETEPDKIRIMVETASDEGRY